MGKTVHFKRPSQQTRKSMVIKIFANGKYLFSIKNGENITHTFEEDKIEIYGKNSWLRSKTITLEEEKEDYIIRVSAKEIKHYKLQLIFVSIFFITSHFAILISKTMQYIYGGIALLILISLIWDLNPKKGKIIMLDLEEETKKE